MSSNMRIGINGAGSLNSLDEVVDQIAALVNARLS